MEGVSKEWERKHLCQIADACKALGRDSRLSPERRESFAGLYPLASRLAKGPNRVAERGVSAVVAAFCDACRDVPLHGCLGRRHWSEHCQMLVDAFVHRGKFARK